MKKLLKEFSSELNESTIESKYPGYEDEEFVSEPVQTTIDNILYDHMQSAKSKKEIELIQRIRQDIQDYFEVVFARMV